jgi:CubicO group peptidase (beta-lactamase class C family)
VRHVTGASLRDFARAEFAQPCGMEHEMGIGVPGDAPAVATLVLQRPKSELPSRVTTPQAAPETTTASSGRRPAASPSLLLNPTYSNNAKIREASLPSANGHFTARALTAFYNRLHDTGLPQRLLKLRGDESAKGDIAPEGERMLQGDEREFLSGFVLYDASERSITFGHSGLGGATALCHCDTETGASVCVAVTLNRLTFDSKLTRRVVRHIFTELKLPVPPAFAKD